jgi:CheY-like chemotaxis protein
MSSPGQGSRFVLYLPVTYMPPRMGRKLLAAGEAPAVLPLENPKSEIFPVRLGELKEIQIAKQENPKREGGMVSDFENSDLRFPSDFGLRTLDLAPAGDNGAGALPALRDAAPPEPAAAELVNEVGDDREDIRPGDRVLVIAENDLSFARFLLDTAREKGFKGLVTSLGAAALALVREYEPHAITLDIYLPDIEGWRVLERLKNDIATRHIPVCVISTDDSRDRALTSGALAFVAKPIPSRDVLDTLLDQLSDFIGRGMKSLLVVEPDSDRRARIRDTIEAEDIQVTAVPDGPAALQMLKERRTDCVVLSPVASDLAGALRGADCQSVLPRDNAGEFVLRRLPVIVYDDGEVIHDDDGTWKALAEVCTVRRVHSPERLLDLTTFFLHGSVAKLPEEKRQMLLDLHHSDKLVARKKVLIVDDDMRNIFALSTVLEEHDMMTVAADNGRDAIKILRQDRNIDIVLMDIMMPEMDGMETMREIRKVPELKNLPIVAVTAKAMKGDREKCIEAGAWDYLAKPVDTQQMLAVLRAWLHR